MLFSALLLGPKVIELFVLLAFIALAAAQSSAQTRIHSAILVIDTSNNASYNQVHWLVRTPYLSIKASNVAGINCLDLTVAANRVGPLRNKRRLTDVQQPLHPPLLGVLGFTVVPSSIIIGSLAFAT